MKEKIKKYFGEILLVVGSFITTYNLFNFRYSRNCGWTLGSGECDNPIAYYYTDGILIMLSVGVVLLVIGILIIKNKNK